MNEELKFLEDAGLDTFAGLDYTGAKDKYLSAVFRYFSSYEKNSARVREYYAAKDYENFMISVHALKSNSKMIGATSLSKLFEALEYAVKNGDTAFIEENTDSVLSEYRMLVRRLEPIQELGNLRAADEIGAAEAKEIADKLLTALDDFDDDLSKELVGRLSGYPFRMTQRELLKKAAELINDFLYDDAAEIVREILPSIE